MQMERDQRQQQQRCDQYVMTLVVSVSDLHDEKKE
jgi:hypothetical protein